MNKTLGLGVIYTDQNSLSRPATISALNDDGSVNLAVFVPENEGFRNDQTSVQYSAISSPNTWSNLS